MKKLVLILTLVCICAFAAPAFANPFSDVAADHWAYDAIDKLSEDGILVGNPDGTYKGNKTMTRYEMATMVARAMAASEADDAKITAENKALIDKLAAEFGSELDALGVRVTALENKVGNVKFTGVARIRMVDEDLEAKDNKAFGTIDIPNVKADKTKYDMRIRLKATAQVNDKVTVNARFTTDNVDLESDNGGNNVDAKFDQYNVKYASDKLTLIVGRDDAWLGKGSIIDDNLLGAQLIVPFGPVKFAAITGRLDNKDTKGLAEGLYNNAGIITYNGDFNLTAFELSSELGNINWGFDYGWIEAKKDDNAFGLGEDKINVFGVNAEYAFNDKLSVWTEYVKTDVNYKDVCDDALFVGVDYKVHPRLSMDLTYGKVGGGALVPGISTWSDGLDNTFYSFCDQADMWKIGLNYDLMKNVKLYADYWNISSDDVFTTRYVRSGKTDYQRIETGLEFKF